MVNEANINKVIEMLRRETTVLAMNEWTLGTGDPCCTVACIGGWAELLMWKECGIENINVEEWLGIDEHMQGWDLFCMSGSGWGMGRFDGAYTNEQRKARAIRVLEILRDEGVVNWRRAIGEVDEEEANGKAGESAWDALKGVVEG